MKRKRILINIIIILVSIFLVYKIFSYMELKSAENTSVKIYNNIKENSNEIQDKEDMIDFESLKKINDDIFLWIKSDQKSIDYPVVQCGDNDKYLHTAANGKENKLGAIFMDYRNESIYDPLVLIYGHMMKSDSMFGSLKDFKQEGHTDGFTFYTEENRFRTKPVMASIISGETYIDPRQYQDFEKRQELYKFLKENSVYDTGYSLKEDDRMIGLITCTYEKRNARLFVVTIAEK